MRAFSAAASFWRFDGGGKTVAMLDLPWEDNVQS
jgi:hypothetical protein